MVTSKIAMFTAMPAGISPKGSFTIRFMAPGSSNAAMASSVARWNDAL